MRLSLAGAVARSGRDPLTGLVLRDRFRAFLAAAMRSARRSETYLGVFFLDLDDFKQVNDACGHADGDRLLRQAGTRLTESLHPGDEVARLGGDEFAVLVRGRRDAAEVLVAAQRLSQALATPYRLQARSVTCPASIGVTVFAPTSGVGAAVMGVDDVLREADLAMYEAKAAGSGHVERFEPSMLERALRRARTTAGLERALDAMQIGLVYQPIHDASSMVVVAAEALVRFTDPEEGLLPPSGHSDEREPPESLLAHPAELLELAESIDRIDVVTRWVLTTALRSAASWPTVAGAELEVTVNLSPRQLSPEWLVPTLHAQLLETGLSPHRLVVELTESSGPVATPAVQAAVGRLRGIGVQVDLDDVGTRFSALSDLRGLAVDGLKIDRTFVMAMDRDPSAAAVVRGLAGIGRELGLRVTAEGVDRLEVASALAMTACTRVQGYLYSPPLEEADLFRLLSAQS